MTHFYIQNQCLVGSMIILLRYVEGNGKTLTLAPNRQQREEMWRRSIAVGSATFVQKTRELLGLRAKGRKVAQVGDAFMLRETQEPYDADFTAENRPIGVKSG